MGIFQPSHPWIVNILFLLGQLYASFSSNLRLCLAVEIIFTHLLIDISDFYRDRVPGMSTPGTVGVLPAPRGVPKTEVTFDIDAIQWSGVRVSQGPRNSKGTTDYPTVIWWTVYGKD